MHMGSEEKCNQLRLIIIPVYIQETHFEGDQDKRG